MKCVKKSSGDIVRISNDMAERLVKKNEATYIAKKAWKALRPKVSNDAT